MKEILIITGACGVGKSTIGREWASLKNGASINCDHLTGWIYDKNFPKWSLEEERLIANVSSKIAREYLNFGMPTSIENVWSPFGIEILKNELLVHADIRLKAIWLSCEISENHRRDQQRIKDHQMHERVDIVNKELEAYDWPAYLHKIDTTHLSIKQTLKVIEEMK